MQDRKVLDELSVVDVEQYMSDRSDPIGQCKIVAECLKEYGVLIVRDPRASEKDNNTFLDMMEKYFEQTDFVQDARPKYSFQVGVTPELTERPKNHCSRVETTLDPAHFPITICPPELDKKSRFFWRVGPRPKDTKFQELNAEPVVPADFPQWETIMDMWGSKMLEAVHQVVEMAAKGLGLQPDVFQKLLQNGPHLLAPTGSNFNVHNKLNDVLAGYHYDLNLLTIHGKSRFPGLYIWLRDGRKIRVKVPDGCLLVQAGKQMEYLTGGSILAGFHEVVVSKETLDAIEMSKQQQKSLWRVSSTLFSHTSSDQVLEPIGPFATEQAKALYPPILAGDHVRKELEHINLSKNSHA